MPHWSRRQVAGAWDEVTGGGGVQVGRLGWITGAGRVWVAPLLSSTCHPLPAKKGIQMLQIHNRSPDGAGPVQVAGYGIIFGGRDLHGDQFTPATDFGLLREVRGMGVYYDHGQRSPRQPIGTVRHVHADAVGLWFEVELDRHCAYLAALLKLIERGALGFSTGALAHLIERQQQTITRWIIGEISLTPAPAEPRCLGVQVADPTNGHDSGRIHQKGLGTMQTNESNATGGEMSALTQISDQLEAVAARIERVEQVLDAPVGRSAYLLPSQSNAASDAALKSFTRYLRSGVKAALQEDTLGEGGYLVPQAYSRELVQALGTMSVLRQAGARVLRIAGTNSMKVPVLNASSAAVLTLEESTFNEAEPTFEQVEFKPYKYTRLAKVSDELLADSGVDIVAGVLLPDFAQAFAKAENTAFATGTGTNQPQGVVTGATVVDTATAATFAVDDILRLYHALPQIYHQQAVWLMNDAVAQVIRSFKDSTGNSLWQPGLAEGTPDRLLGRPVYRLNTMSNLLTAGQKIIVFGDLSYYWIVDFGQETLKRLEELYAATGQVGFRAYRRVDGQVVLADALRVLCVKA